VLRSAGRANRFEEPLAAVQPLLADAKLPLKWRARLGAWSALCLANLDRLEQARARAHDALDDAQRSNDALAIGYARHALAIMSGASSFIAHIDAALAVLGDDPESMDLRMLLLSNRLGRLVATGRRDEFEATMPKGLVMAERVGTLRSANLLAHAAYACYYHGKWDDAVLHVDSVNPEYLENPSLTQLHALVALIALHRGDRELGESRLRAAGIRTEADLPPSAPTVTDALATWQEVNGDLDRALATRARWLGLGPGAYLETRCDEALYLVRLALAAGDARTAEAAIDTLTPEADSATDRVLAAQCCRALVDRDADQLLDVAEEYRRLGWPLHVGLTQEEASHCLASAGDIPRARTAFNNALRSYADLGAAWDIARAEAKLRPYGIRRGSRTFHRRPTTGWDALTPTERRVTELVAHGLSNPDIAEELFLSRNTVQTHVSHILAKLTLRSRVELLRSFAERAEAGDS
jgi:DNA-binding CsgD family transcriptional regulator